MASVEGAQPAGVLRRLGAMLYDTLLVLAIVLVITFAFLPFTHGEAIMATRFPLIALLYNFARIAAIVLFFGCFWTRRGRTLGMQAWRLRLLRIDGALPTWSDALKRLAGASVSLLALGLGYFWIWVDKDRLAWHDRWSSTRVIVLPKVAKGR